MKEVLPQGVWVFLFLGSLALLLTPFFSGQRIATITIPEIATPFRWIASIWGAAFFLTALLLYNVDTAAVDTKALSSAKTLNPRQAWRLEEPHSGIVRLRVLNPGFVEITVNGDVNMELYEGRWKPMPGNEKTTQIRAVRITPNAAQIEVQLVADTN